MVEEWISEGEAANWLGVPIRAVQEAIKRGELPALRFGRQVRLSRTALIAAAGGNSDTQNLAAWSGSPAGPSGGRETDEEDTGVPAPAQLEWRQALAPSEPFEQGWPREGGGSAPERYPHSWAGAITLAGSERRVVVGESTGDERLDNRRRLLVLLDAYPTAEFAPTVDGLGWASVIKPDGRRTIPAWRSPAAAVPSRARRALPRGHWTGRSRASKGLGRCHRPRRYPERGTSCCC